jgi:hypothetical protein
VRGWGEDRRGVRARVEAGPAAREPSRITRPELAPSGSSICELAESSCGLRATFYLELGNSTFVRQVQGSAGGHLSSPSYDLIPPGKEFGRLLPF